MSQVKLMKINFESYCPIKNITTEELQLLEDDNIEYTFKNGHALIDNIKYDMAKVLEHIGRNEEADKYRSRHKNEYINA